MPRLTSQAPGSPVLLCELLLASHLMISLAPGPPPLSRRSASHSPGNLLGHHALTADSLQMIPCLLQVIPTLDVTPPTNRGGRLVLYWRVCGRGAGRDMRPPWRPASLQSVGWSVPACITSSLADGSEAKAKRRVRLGMLLYRLAPPGSRLVTTERRRCRGVWAMGGLAV